jgi:hypothetical protein
MIGPTQVKEKMTRAFLHGFSTHSANLSRIKSASVEAFAAWQ